MLPRYTSDYRTLFWALVLFPLAPAIGYTSPSALFAIIPFALYTSYCAGVLTHNHVHVPVFRARAANSLYSAWLSIFYGCPVAFWIPTHLEHHHRFVDGPEDITRTTRRSVKHDLWQALVYTTACASWQRPLIASYIRRAHARRGPHWAALRDQSLALVIAHAAMLTLALSSFGPWRGVLTYALSFGLPAALAPTFMLFTNYIQHIHCDPASPSNHSRNFVSPLANWFVFDAGYHTVHHDRPSLHWSHYESLHKARATTIHPSLQSHSVLTFCIANYLLGPLLPHLRTRPLASAPPSEALALTPTAAPAPSIAPTPRAAPTSRAAAPSAPLAPSTARTPTAAPAPTAVTAADATAPSAAPTPTAAPAPSIAPTPTAAAAAAAAAPSAPRRQSSLPREPPLDVQPLQLSDF